MDLVLLGSFAGGIGLFLLGMKLMTSGLKLAAGHALRRILGQWTRSPLRGLLSGILITSVVQSSSAVTVAIIGFVNAGLLSLPRTINVIFGTNIGTTMTSWLVALVGFKVNVMAFALPMVGVGMVLNLVGGKGRRGAAGEALTGFGLFFLGIAVLKDAFAGFGGSLPLHEVAGEDMGWMVLFVGAGFLLTFLMQSSSAAMAVILTAVGGGVIPFSAAAAAVIGANVGTTSTAALAVIGATPNAQRAAAAHVLFNLLTALVAFLLLPLLLHVVPGSGGPAAAVQAPATALAVFHSGFNVLGVALLWPFTGTLASFLERRFRSEEEDLGRPRHLDNNVVATPALALDALTLELERIGGVARSMAVEALSVEKRPERHLMIEKNALERLVEAVRQFGIRMQRANLPEDIGQALPNALRVARYFTMVGEIATEVVDAQEELEFMADTALAERAAQFRGDCVQLLRAVDPGLPDYSPQFAQDLSQAVEESYQALKERLLQCGASERLKVEQMVVQLDQYSRIRRLLRQAVKGSRYLADLLHLAARFRQKQENAAGGSA